MKKPRIDAFVTPDKVRELSSPLDGLPAIRPHGVSVPEQRVQEVPNSAPVAVIPPKPLALTPVEKLVGGTAATTPEPPDLADYPTKTVTFPVTEQESLILDQLKLDITRTYQPPITATKEKLLRLAIHYLADDFRRNGDKSFAVQTLRKKSK